MRLAFEVLGVPVAKGRGRVAVFGKHAHVYTPTKTRKAEESLAARVIAFRPPTPITEPIRLVAKFVMPAPSSWPKKRRAMLCDELRMPHITRPDLDNLLKLLKDALNGIFWLDDKQIYDVRASKCYGETPRTIVEIYSFADEYTTSIVTPREKVVVDDDSIPF